MGNSTTIGEFEQLVVLAVLRLGSEAFVEEYSIN